MSSADVLYEDKYVKLTKTKLIIKCYYFPTTQAKHIDIGSIQKIYYNDQVVFYKQCGLTKGWGMSLSPIWWACDLGRGLRNSRELNNVVVDIGDAIYKGCTVADIAAFLNSIRPLLPSHASIQKDIPF
jgi:hypothetical protein